MKLALILTIACLAHVARSDGEDDNMDWFMKFLAQMLQNNQQPAGNVNVNVKVNNTDNKINNIKHAAGRQQIPIENEIIMEKVPVYITPPPPPETTQATTTAAPVTTKNGPVYSPETINYGSYHEDVIIVDEDDWNRFQPPAPEIPHQLRTTPRPAYVPRQQYVTPPEPQIAPGPPLIAPSHTRVTAPQYAPGPSLGSSSHQHPQHAPSQHSHDGLGSHHHAPAPQYTTPDPRENVPQTPASVFAPMRQPPPNGYYRYPTYQRQRNIWGRK